MLSSVICTPAGSASRSISAYLERTYSPRLRRFLTNAFHSSFHINATERSVNTLSGGEAFLASLSLALGLSDEVQMSTGIHLDTLFVDEGFGSLDSEALGKGYQLDSEALQQALTALVGVSGGCRIVGIISHVAELKERIDRQIVVAKDPDGSSHAELVI